MATKKTDRLHEAGTAELDAMTPEAFELHLVAKLAGRPAPVFAFDSSNLPTPVDKALYLADLLTFFAEAHKAGSPDQRRYLESCIQVYWLASHVPVTPHKYFASIVFYISPRYGTGEDPLSLAQEVIGAFSMSYPELAKKLDPSLVQEALRCAQFDTRKARGETSKWEALANAWGSTGQTRGPETFRVGRSNAQGEFAAAKKKAAKVKLFLRRSRRENYPAARWGHSVIFLLQFAGKVRVFNP